MFFYHMGNGVTSGCFFLYIGYSPRGGFSYLGHRHFLVAWAGFHVVAGETLDVPDMLVSTIRLKYVYVGIINLFFL
jgi:hypothetical protein